MTRRTELAALTGIVVGAAVLYCWRLGVQGWANEYYAAAVQAAAHDWGAFWWAGVEWGGHEALDKPPLFVWPMALSVRAFGLSTWSLLLPQVAMTLLTVVVLQRAVSRTHGAAAGLVAALVLALTPVVVVLARFDDPDVAVTLLSTCAAYGVVRYATGGSRRWVVAAGVAVGLAFLCKWLAGFLVLPALVVGVLATGRPDRWRAVASAAGACAAAALWWVVLYALWPGHHPTPDGGSSLADLLLGRNGFARVVTADVTTRNGISGVPGLARTVRWPMDGQLGWFVPAALAGLWLLWGRDVRGVVGPERTTPAGAPDEWAPGGGSAGGSAGRPVGASAGGRGASAPDVVAVPGRARTAAAALWSTWFVVVTLVLSFMGGPMHPYYLHVIAPGLAAVVALGIAVAGRRPDLMALVVVLTAGTALVILDAHEPIDPLWGRAVELLTIATVVLVVLGRRWRSLLTSAAVTGALAALVGPVCFDVLTVSHAVVGANPTAGPEPRVDTPPLPAAVVDLVRTAPGTYAAAVPMAAHAAMLQLQTDRPVLPVGGYTGRAASPTLGTVQGLVRSGDLRYLVLTGPYVRVRDPKAFADRPTGAIVRWARDTGCVVHGDWGAVTVIDLSHRC